LCDEENRAIGCGGCIRYIPARPLIGRTEDKLSCLTRGIERLIDRAGLLQMCKKNATAAILERSAPVPDDEVTSRSIRQDRATSRPAPVIRPEVATSVDRQLDSPACGRGEGLIELRIVGPAFYAQRSVSVATGDDPRPVGVGGESR
jgi:hypothetical protein